MKRVWKNDPIAMCLIGIKCFNKKEYAKAFDFFTKAVEFGDVEAHLRVAGFYAMGLQVKQDDDKAMFFLEKAAIKGHPFARHQLAAMEHSKGRIDNLDAWNRRKN